MSETSFPMNDLLRRKMQTSLVVVSLALIVASTLFLLLFAQRIGFGISSITEGKLTTGFSRIFSPFITLLTILMFIAGVVMISFTAFIMTSQRTKDIGLMKAAGCPNDILFGYFLTELLVVSFAGCLLGAILGILLDTSSASLLSGLNPHFSQQPANPWTPFAVFIAFFAISLILGIAPVFSAIRAEPIRALSPSSYLGLGKEPGFKILSSGVPTRMAVRNLVRRKSATIRIVLCLSLVFLLVTVAVGGGLIAENTTGSWVQNALGTNVLLIAHQDMINQYRLLLSEFYEGHNGTQFNYEDARYQIPAALLSQISSLNGIRSLDARLILEAQVKEIPGIVLGSSTSETTKVGDNRQGESLIVGVDPAEVVSNWSLNGRFLEENQTAEAVVGDTLAQELFSAPLYQGIRIGSQELSVVGVCLDPINNGNVTYVTIGKLINITGLSGPNMLMVQPDSSVNKADVMKKISSVVAGVANDFQVFDLEDSLNQSLDFLSFLWSTIMFLPVFSLVTSSLNLLGYVVLTINEQRQEFGILRALGARPKTVLGIISMQSLIVVLASYGVGIAFGTILTLLILVQEPLVTTYTVIEIAGWLLVALIATFAVSIYPAMIFTRKPLLETITNP
jgi:putative ABC transport system permease protein